MIYRIDFELRGPSPSTASFFADASSSTQAVAKCEAVFLRRDCCITGWHAYPEGPGAAVVEDPIACACLGIKPLPTCCTCEEAML